MLWVSDKDYIHPSRNGPVSFFFCCFTLFGFGFEQSVFSSFLGEVPSFLPSYFRLVGKQKGNKEK